VDALTPVLSLTYVSSATTLLEESQLVELLTTVRPRNDALGITGMLLYRDGNIIQTLEGPAAEVERTFAHISRDPRHHGVLELLREEVAERRFPQWSMGFRNVGDVDVRSLEGYSTFLSEPAAQAFGGSTEPAYQMLRLFRENMR
jgi:hypothetical protein